MKKVGLLLLIAFSSTLLLYGQETGKASQMTGWLCNSKCVVQTDNKASCDKNCSETSGEVVFIDSQGTVSKIENQDKVAPMAGKRVKMKGWKDKDKDNMMHVEDIAPATF